MNEPKSIPRFPNLPNRLLERYLCQDLPAEQTEEIRKAISASPELSAYMDTRRQQREEFQLQNRFDPIRERIEKRETTGLSNLLAWRGLNAALVAVPICIVLALAIVFWPKSPAGIRVRGDFKATLVVKRQERLFEYHPGVLLHSGDRLRIQIEDLRGGYCWVLGLSERHVVNVYYGNDPNGQPLLIKPGTILLPESLELDDSVDREALYLILSDKAYSNQELQGWLQKAVWDEHFPPSIEPPPQARMVILPLTKEGQ